MLIYTWGQVPGAATQGSSGHLRRVPHPLFLIEGQPQLPSPHRALHDDVIPSWDQLHVTWSCLSMSGPPPSLSCSAGRCTQETITCHVVWLAACAPPQVWGHPFQHSCFTASSGPTSRHGSRVHGCFWKCLLSHPLHLHPFLAHQFKQR